MMKYKGRKIRVQKRNRWKIKHFEAKTEINKIWEGERSGKCSKPNCILKGNKKMQNQKKDFTGGEGTKNSKQNDGRMTNIAKNVISKTVKK